MDQVSTFINKQSVEHQAELTRVRTIIQKNYPQTVEKISYGMPAFYYNGKLVLCYAAQKNHYSLYPTSWPIKELEKELKLYDVSKGAVRYTKENLITENLLIKLTKVRIKQIISSI